MLKSIAAVNCSQKSSKVSKCRVFVLTYIVFTCRFGSLMQVHHLGALLQQQPVPILPQAEYRRVIESSPSARLAGNPALPHSAFPSQSSVSGPPPLLLHLTAPFRHTLPCPALPCSIPPYPASYLKFCFTQIR